MKLKTFIFLLCFCQFVFCQTKNEKEKRIPLAEFPEAAKAVIKNLPDDCKRLKFYKETDGEKQSFEVKFKYKRKRYSLEFSEDGNIEDQIKKHRRDRKNQNRKLFCILFY